MNKEMVARELLGMAKELVAVDAAKGDEAVDETFRQRLVAVRAKLTALASKKNKTLHAMGIDTVLRPSTSSVQDLVGVLERLLA